MILLFAPILLYFTAIYMVNPFLPQYVTNLGGSYVDFGLIVSIASLFSSLIQSYIGFLSDKIGSRNIIIIGGFSSAIFTFLMVFIKSKLQLLFLYILLGISIGIIIPSIFTMICKIKTNKGISLIPYYRSFQSIGVIIGPIIGGWVIETSLKINLIVCACFMVISIILLIFYFYLNRQKLCSENSLNYNKTEKQSFINALKNSFSNKAFLLICLLFILVELSFDSIRLSIPIIGAGLHINSALIGISYSAYFITFALFQIPINNYLMRFKVKAALLYLGLASLIPCIIFILNLPFIFTVIAMGLTGVTLGSLFSYCSVAASNTAAQEHQGTYMGVFNSIMPLTDVVTPLMVSSMVSFNFKLPFVFALSVMSLFVVLTKRLFNPDLLLTKDQTFSKTS